MTKRDILAKILSEASGKPIDAVTALVEFAFSSIPKHELDTELTEEEANKQLATLRTQLPGICHWLEQGAAEVRKG